LETLETHILRFHDITPAPGWRVVACSQLGPDGKPVFEDWHVVGWGVVTFEPKDADARVLRDRLELLVKMDMRPDALPLSCIDPDWEPVFLVYEIFPPGTDFDDAAKNEMLGRLKWQVSQSLKRWADKNRINATRQADCKHMKVRSIGKAKLLAIQDLGEIGERPVVRLKWLSSDKKLSVSEDVEATLRKGSRLNEVLYDLLGFKEKPGDFYAKDAVGKRSTKEVMIAKPFEIIATVKQQTKLHQ